MAENPAKEWDDLLQSVAQTKQAIQQRKASLLGKLSQVETAIFDAHLLILQDPDLLEAVEKRIKEQHENAAAAWSSAIQQAAASYRELEDPYLQQRAADVTDVGRPVLRALAGGPQTTVIELKEPVILFAEDLTPTETSQLDMNRVLGIMLVGGGPTSHSAILSRRWGYRRFPASARRWDGWSQVPGWRSTASTGRCGSIRRKRRAWTSRSAGRNGSRAARS